MLFKIRRLTTLELPGTNCTPVNYLLVDLEKAISCNRVNDILRISNEAIDINEPLDRLGNTALHLAVDTSFEATLALINNPAISIDSRNSLSMLPLDSAAKYLNKQIVVALVEQGALCSLKYAEAIEKIRQYLYYAFTDLIAVLFMFGPDHRMYSSQSFIDLIEYYASVFRRSSIKQALCWQNPFTNQMENMATSFLQRPEPGGNGKARIPPELTELISISNLRISELIKRVEGKPSEDIILKNLVLDKIIVLLPVNLKYGVNSLQIPDCIRWQILQRNQNFA